MSVGTHEVINEDKQVQDKKKKAWTAFNREEKEAAVVFLIRTACPTYRITFALKNEMKVDTRR
jgi:hypothetical protein